MPVTRPAVDRRSDALRAAWFDGAVRVEGGRGEPALAAGEALIRPLRVGVTPEDVNAAGAANGFRGVLGHQFVGVVERVAAGVPPRWVGARVVGSPVIACGACDRCRAGLGAHCRTRRVMGLDGRDGCLADLFALPAANVVEVPARLSDDAAVLAVSAGRAVHAARLARAGGHAFATVLGDSVEALLLAQVLARRGVPVRVLGERPARFTLCEKWGVKHRAANEAVAREDQDVVFEATGTAGMLELALALVRPRGRVVLMGEAARAGASLARAATDEIEIIGSAGGSVREGVAALAGLETAALLGLRFGLDDVARALAAAAEPDALRVTVEV